MKRICQHLQDVLAEQGPAALRDDSAALEHLESCDDCVATLDALQQLDATFAEMMPEDAPDDVVAALLAHPELMLPPDDGSPSGAVRSPGWLMTVFGSWNRGFFDRLPSRSFAVAALFVVGIVALSLFWPRLRQASAPESQQFAEGDVSEIASVALDDDAGRVDVSEDLMVSGKGDGQKQNLQSSERSRDELRSQLKELRKAGADGARSDEPSSSPEPKKLAPVPPAAPAPRPSARRRAIPSREAPKEQKPVIEEEIMVIGEPEEIVVARTYASQYVAKDELNDLEKLFFSRDRTAEKKQIEKRDQAGERFTDVNVDKKLEDGRTSIDVGDEGAMRLNEQQIQSESVRDELVSLGYIGEGFDQDDSAIGQDADGAKDAAARAAARQFLEQRRQLEELTFETPVGYWKNTHVPGDRSLRQLQARVESTLGGEGPALHEASRRPARPFDPPTDAALALYLNADQAAVQGPTRLLVQVGLQGTERYSGQRPAMNVAMVLDLRGEITAEHGAVMRSLVEVLAKARQIDDRFQLIVTGRPGALIVEPGNFRHGPLTVALQRLFGSPEPVLAETWDLPRALVEALDVIGQSDDPTAPLGSSMVVLVTSQELGDSFYDGGEDGVWEAVRQGAVAGLPLSVIGIGDRVDVDELDRLALHGQGNRRWLGAQAEAAGVIERELAALGRVIARAVRLRLRLAPGVKLVEVVGSRKLDPPAVDEVREAERSIDQRIARNLGIEADRGEDEVGIQIVVPTFHAGDHHVVLLDVVVPGPGPVVDVRARYKDLVKLGNGVSRAQLTLPAGSVAQGPLQRHVLKSLLAHHTRTALKQTGDQLAAGLDAEAFEILRAHRDLLRGLRQMTPGLDKDRDLMADLEMIEQYLARMMALPSDEMEPRRRFADSLRYAGELKLQSRPEPKARGPGSG